MSQPATSPKSVYAKSRGVPAVNEKSPSPDSTFNVGSKELFVDAFARGLAVIRAFANRHRPLTIAEVSRGTGFSRSSVSRMLYTLVQLDYASVHDGRFSLSPKTLLLGSAFLSSDALFELGQPFVNRLAEELGGFCSLDVAEGYETLMVCLAYSQMPPEIKLKHPKVGSGDPMYCSASGLVFLGTYSADQLNWYFAHVPLRPITQRTCTERTELEKRLGQVHALGYALVDREISDDLRSVAVPVRDRTGRVIAALVSMATPKQESKRNMQARVPALQAAALDLGKHL